MDDDGCEGIDFFRVSEGCGIEVRTELDWDDCRDAFTYNEGTANVCGEDDIGGCGRETPGCDSVRCLTCVETINNGSASSTRVRQENSPRPLLSNSGRDVTP